MAIGFIIFFILDVIGFLIPLIIGLIAGFLPIPVVIAW
jgi:hypothetical protein